ncbi:ribokinase [Piscinibacter sp.]|uniref:ribokinase n=1 Tax=Piscinibacter sp. TaxID=1903157 RepID=UPI002BC84BA1|nr:ribokinase [Albitalea sp.]HUG22503.1 ribokinase [Albitalea sp.]
MPRLLVFGSINLDLSIPVPRLPAPGETLLGDAALVAPGGKGANQAHAARLQGCEVALVGAVGDDAFGPPALRLLAEAGVDLDGVRRLGGTSTGIASICVMPDGDNAIVVSPGANGLVRADWVPDAALQAAQLVLLQMEVPVEESMQLARRAKRAGCTVVMNLAPAHALNAIDMHALDWLMLNQTELATLCKALALPGTSPHSQASLIAAELGVSVVLTLGSDGALLCTLDGHTVAEAAQPGPVVDTTGAGDTLAGVFAACLAEGIAPERALRRGVVAAGLACRHPGAQAAQPRRIHIDEALEFP